MKKQTLTILFCAQFLLSMLTKNAFSAEVSEPVPVSNLKRYFFNFSAHYLDRNGDTIDQIRRFGNVPATGQYLSYTPTGEFPGFIAIGGIVSEDESNTLRLVLPGAKIVPCRERPIPREETRVPLSAGMTPFDTAEKLNVIAREKGWEVIPTHLKTGAELPPTDVFRIQTVEGIRPPVIRNETEMATLKRIFDFKGVAIDGYRRIRGGGQFLRPTKYTSEFAALGEELNQFIENGQSSLTLEEIGKLGELSAFPGLSFGAIGSYFYNSGTRVRFWDNRVNQERTGIFIKTSSVDTRGRSRCDGDLFHAVLSVDIDTKVFNWDSVYPSDIRSVIADPPIDDLL